MGWGVYLCKDLLLVGAMGVLDGGKGGMGFRLEQFASCNYRCL